MYTITFSYKVKITLVIFLLTALTTFCQKKNSHVTNQYSASIIARNTEKLARLTALFDGGTDSDLEKNKIVVYAETYRSELIKLENNQSLTGIHNTYKLLKDSAGKLLAIRQIPLIDVDDEYLEFTHYFDNKGKTFATTVYQHFYLDRWENVTAYRTTTTFYDSNFNEIGKIEKLVDKKNKPLKKEIDFEWYDKPYFYRNADGCLSKLDGLQEFTSDSTFPKHEYFYLTGSRFEYSDATGKTPIKTKVVQPEVPNYDTLTWFNDLANGMEYARQNMKYLVVYYQPANCESCWYTVNEKLKEWNDFALFSDQKFFNENYVLVIARERDTTFLQQAGVKRFPGAAIFTDDNKILYYNHDIVLDALLTGLAPKSTGENFLELLRIHYFTTYAAEAIKSSGFNAQPIKIYLNMYLREASAIQNLQGEQKRKEQSIDDKNSYIRYLKQKGGNQAFADTADTPFITDYNQPNEAKEEKKITTGQLPEEENIDENDTLSEYPPYVVDTVQLDSNESSFNFKVDTAFILEMLDAVVAKADTSNISTVSLIVTTTDLLDNYYCPFYVSSFLSGNSTLFKPTLAYSYLLKNFQAFKHLEFGDISFYQVVSKPLNNFIRYNLTDYGPVIKQALLIQQQFVEAAPELKHLETPLLITNILQHADNINIDSLLNIVAVPYLDAIISSKPSSTGFISGIAKELVKKFRKEVKYVQSYISPFDYYPSDDKNEFINHFSVYLKEIFSYLLDEVACHYYLNKDDSASLKRAIRYSKASILLNPLDPYPLKTYALLIYRTGNRPEAISYCGKALSLASKSNYYPFTRRSNLTDEQQLNLFKEELSEIRFLPPINPTISGLRFYIEKKVNYFKDTLSTT